MVNANFLATVSMLLERRHLRVVLLAVVLLMTSGVAEAAVTVRSVELSSNKDTLTFTLAGIPAGLSGSAKNRLRFKFKPDYSSESLGSNPGPLKWDSGASTANFNKTSRGNDFWRFYFVRGSLDASETFVLPLGVGHTIQGGEVMTFDNKAAFTVDVTIPTEPYDYTLSVNPNSVREDAGRTKIVVKAKAKEAQTSDTQINLSLSDPALLNTRYRIELPTLKIPKGKKEVTGTIIFTPIEDDKITADLTITIMGSVGGNKSVGSADVTLTDSDKVSTQISLSFSDADLSKKDSATNIIVTATLNGKTLTRDLSFSLVIDEAGEGSAERDTDYTAALATITIPDRRVSGKATITIVPKGVGTGKIWLKANKDLTDSKGNTIAVIPNSIEITTVPTTVIEGLTAAPFSIREDAGPKEVTLNLSLQNALLINETVQITITDNSDDLCKDEDSASESDCPFEGAVHAVRDVDYSVKVQPIIVPKGKTKGTTTITVTPINNAKENSKRAFKVNAKVRDNPPFVAGILITDDDTLSDMVTLEVSATEIIEGTGAQEVTVTGTLNGKESKDNVVVILTIDEDINGDGEVNDDDKAATRDVDYVASLATLVIPSGSTTGRATITIIPIADNAEEDDEKIRLISAAASPPKAKDADGDVRVLTVNAATLMLKDPQAGSTPPKSPDPGIPAFAANDTIADQEYVVGTAIDSLVLPAATGGNGDLTYSISTLPAGLAFDAATRTLSGTPSVATDGASNMVYTVIDGDNDANALVFSIAVTRAVLPAPTTDAKLTVVPSSIREDAEVTQILLTVTLAAAKATSEQVRITIVDPSEGTPAVRDSDYAAALEPVINIPAGATVGTAMLTLTPLDNTQLDGSRVLGVQARFASGATLLNNIAISDDETASKSIELSVNPQAISEEGDETSVTVTATLDGKALSEDARVTVFIDETSTATRDLDYSARFNPQLVIPAGSLTGSGLFVIRPIDDIITEGREIIKLTGVIDGLAGDEAEIVLSDEKIALSDKEQPLGFAAGVSIADREYTAEHAITPLVLPAASGGTGDLKYSVSALPVGLAFDAATRTISGTPTAETDVVNIIYAVIDGDGETAVLSFSIKINPTLSFEAFFDLFRNASGKVVPTASSDLAEIREFIVGQRVEGLALPEASGGTAPLTYRLSPPLPPGLVFDAATRTIAGTPRAEAKHAEYTYMVTDANGASASLSLQTLPTAFSLAANYPNPFNPTTTIQYALPQAVDVELTVYNVVGQPVRTLVAEHQSAGRYAVEWDAADDSGQSVSSGLYFYRLQAGGEFHQAKRMLLLK